MIRLPQNDSSHRKDVGYRLHFLKWHVFNGLATKTRRRREKWECGKKTTCSKLGPLLCLSVLLPASVFPNLRSLMAPSQSALVRNRSPQSPRRWFIPSAFTYPACAVCPASFTLCLFAFALQPCTLRHFPP